MQLSCVRAERSCRHFGSQRSLHTELLPTLAGTVLSPSPQPYASARGLLVVSCCACGAYLLGRTGSRHNGTRAHRALDERAQTTPLLTQLEVEAFTSVDDMAGLHVALKAAYDDSARKMSGMHLPESAERRGAGFRKTAVHKLEHDIEQLEYLAARNANSSEWLASEVLPAFRNILAHAQQGDPGDFYWFDFAPSEVARAVQEFYNKGLCIPEANRVSTYLGEFDGTSVEHDYSKKRVAVVDDVLSPEAFGSIRQLLLDSTFWHEAKAANRVGGYVGAYLTDGLHDRVLLDLSSALRDRLPGIFEKAPLRFLWAYKYDHRYTGINIHADDAAVNVNIWLTPDCSNLDSSSGGLVVYDTAPPVEWNEVDYYNAERNGFESLLAPSGWAHVAVPYKANRMVLFDSTLLHKTDDFSFKAGYENRRMNLTMLFGQRPHG